MPAWMTSELRDLVWLTGDAAMALEPQLVRVAVVLSTSTGIIDGHQLMLALEGDLETAGGGVVLNAPVEWGELRNDGMLLSVGGSEPMRLQADTVINAVGFGVV